MSSSFTTRISSSSCRTTKATTTTASTILLIQFVLIIIQVVVVRAVTYYEYKPGALQTGPDVGSTFASAAVYDVNDHSLMITGTTFGTLFDMDGLQPDESNKIKSTKPVNATCFMVVAGMPNPSPSDEDASDSEMVWEESQYITNNVAPTPRNNEICSYLLRHDTKIYVVGTSENNGYSTIQSEVTQGTMVRPKELGMIFEFDGSVMDSKGIYLPVVGGRIFQTYRSTYPQVMYGKPGNSELYVASIVSKQSIPAVTDDTTIDPFQALSDSTDNLFSARIEQLYYKSKNDLQPFSATATDVQDTFTSGWNAIIASSNAKNVFVTGIMEVPSESAVFVVGYTDGGNGEYIGASDDATYDGYITKLSTNTGQLDTQSRVPYRRIKSTNQKDDVIMGMCVDEISNTESPEYIYIVGWTKGYFDTQPDGSTSNPDSVQAYVMKIDVVSLETMWTQQIGADDTSGAYANIKGISCAVTSDSNEIWFAGNIENGALLKNAGTTNSYGGSDIFVVKISATDGSEIFRRQFGSAGDDTVAARNGLLVDTKGNAIIVGSTTGSLYRQRSTDENESSSDIFVMTVSRDNGDLIAPIEHPEYRITDDTNSDATPTAEPVFETLSPVPAPVEAPTQTTTVTDDNNNNDNSNNDSNNSGGGGDTSSTVTSTVTPPASSPDNEHSPRWKFLVTTLCLLILAVVVGVYYTNQRMAYREVVTDRAKVLSYMGAFDVEEIDLKHSATGGWHCSYTGDLALGRNHREYDDINGGGYSTSRYNGSTGSLLLGGEGLDPLDPTSTGSQRLLDRTSAEYGLENYSNGGGNDLSVRERGRTSALFMDDEDNVNININNDRMGSGSIRSTSSSSSSSTSRNRRSLSQNNNNNNNNTYDDGYEGLVSNYNTTWDQNGGGGGGTSLTKPPTSPRRSGSSPRRSNSSRRSKSSNIDPNSLAPIPPLSPRKGGGNVWGKDIV